MERLIECVPNFSEGRCPEVIDGIVAAIASVPGVQVLDVDPGQAANRTVVTFVGAPEAVVEAAFRGARQAGESIDMRVQHGTHPRSGATDVLPLIPVSGITLEECAALARALAERMFRELGIPCYCYEAAAFFPERRNLAWCRAGEYEALPEKMADPVRKPDFGGAYGQTVARTGASNVGARPFLVAVNFNLDTADAALAHEVACDVRQKGRKALSADGTPLKDAQGRQLWIPGPLKGCKALGWYIEEYGIAQVSMNVTDIEATPLHVAFETVRRAAEARGLRVTGTEIIGLVPERVLLEAGRYFLEQAGSCPDGPSEALVATAIRAMGLDDLRPFDPRKKVIEYAMCQATGFPGENYDNSVKLL